MKTRVIAGLGVVAVFLATACTPLAPEGQGEAPPAAVGQPVKLGVLPASTAAIVEEDYGPFVEQLGRALGRPVEIWVAKDYDALVDAVTQKTVHLAQLSSYLYVRAKPALQGEVLAQQRMAWDTEYRGVFAVAKDSKFKDIKELQHKKIAYVDRHSSAGYYYPRMRLRELGHDPDTFFANQIFAGSHKHATELVDKGMVDVAAVSEQTMPEALSVRALERTAVIPDDAIVASDLPPADVAKVRDFLLDAHKNPALTAYMNRRGIETFVRPNMDVYEPLEKEMGLTTEVAAKADEAAAIAPAAAPAAPNDGPTH